METAGKATATTQITTGYARGATLLSWKLFRFSKAASQCTLTEFSWFSIIKLHLVVVAAPLDKLCLSP